MVGERNTKKTRQRAFEIDGEGDRDRDRDGWVKTKERKKERVGKRKLSLQKSRNTFSW